MFIAVFVYLIIFSSVFVGAAYGSIYIDKEVYTWTDKVHIKLITYGYNSDRDVIRIFTSDHELDSYKLSKGENGFYTGEIILTGFLHDANGDGESDTNPRTTGSGSNDGFLETKRDGGLTISLEFADGTVMSKSAKITWNMGKIAFDMPTYATVDLARLQVIDPDMNLNPETLDKILVHVFSDSDRAGILVNAVETQEESGLFEVMVSFSQDKPSSGNRLFAILEDTIYAKYEDHTLPAPYSLRDDLDIIAKSTVKTDFKRLQSNVDDVLSNEHEFPTVYQIPDFEVSADSSILSLDKWNLGEVHWLEASYPASGTGVVRVIDPDMNLDSDKVDNFVIDIWSDSDAAGIDLTVTETSEETGVFEVTVFFTTFDDSSGHRLRVTEGDTITAEYEDSTLPEPYTTADEIDIVGTSMIQKIPSPKQQIKNNIEPTDISCNTGLVLIFKASDNSPACVKPSTVQKLVERGWTNR